MARLQKEKRKSKMEKIAISIPKELLRLVDRYAQQNLEDRSTAIRQLLAQGLRYRKLQAAAEQYRQGEATLWEIAAQLGLSYREAEEVLRTLGVPLVHVDRPDIDLEEIEQQAKRLRPTKT